MLKDLEEQVPIKENPIGSPSLWYMPLIGGEHFFDGFGFAQYRDRFKWQRVEMDDREDANPPQKPLLPFLEGLNQQLPTKWDRHLQKFGPNDDWLLWKLDRGTAPGAQVEGDHQSK
jgi:hypothetical protein